MQIKVCREKENCNFLTKFVLISFFSTLFLIIFLFETVSICFLQILRKLAAVLLKI